MGDFDLEVSDSGGLAGFADKLRRLGSSDGIKRINEAAAVAVKDRVDLEFTRGEDPYGNPWRSTVRGNSPPLTGPTKKLSGSVSYEVTAEGFIIAVTDWKAIFHQGGTTRGVPARPMLPVGGALPEQWSYAMSLAVPAEIAAILDIGSDGGGEGSE